MTRSEEVRTKLERVRRYLEAAGLQGALFATHANFAWLTGGGRSHISTVTERGVAGILVTPERALLLADNIELRRIEQEELGEPLFEAREFPWWSDSIPGIAAREISPALLAADIPTPGARSFQPEELIRLRNPLLPPEIARYRLLGEQVGIVLTHAAQHCRPALTEHQLAGMLTAGLMDYGITPAVVLAAVDERAHTRRHPLPTDRRLERYAMLVVGARRDGLNVSATRLVHFGPPPRTLARKHLACARVDAAFWSATRPGAPLAEVFAAGARAYAREGWTDEWQQHHQGGPTGYAGRDRRATPECSGEVMLHQAFAWNPSISGVKSEDTFLVTTDGWELLSPTPDLPAIEVEGPSGPLRRPGILER